jgi:hypothetical protein
MMSPSAKRERVRALARRWRDRIAKAHGEEHAEQWCAGPIAYFLRKYDAIISA